MTPEKTLLDGPIEDALEDYRRISSQKQSAFDEYQLKSKASEVAWDKLVNLIRARHLLVTGESIAPSEAREVISAKLNPSKPDVDVEGPRLEEPEPKRRKPEPEGEEPELEEGEEPGSGLDPEPENGQEELETDG